MSTILFVMLGAFQIKHLIADYYLQVPYMYTNKGNKENWVLPLLAHASVHSLGTLFILTLFSFIIIIQLKWIIIACLLDLITHFYIDRWKATQDVGPDTTKFWLDLGTDQMLHHFINIIIVYIVTAL